ncbi:hypothetical protein [Crenalkalicoccus roseus]|uniref:hypothetical protein n=1 Tax=Crenalkalicoccus roseus TaxID=1485588 RepID=UPI0010801FE4|nr:hypothetical protein [Crenalkalicoccus roseus]
MGPVGSFLERNILAVLLGLAVLGALAAALGAGQSAAVIAMLWGGIVMWWTGAGNPTASTGGE